MIVVIAVADLFLWIPLERIGKTSPLLRLLRITRIFAVAGRTVKRAVPEMPDEQVLPLTSRMKVNIFEGGKAVKDASKEEVYRYLTTPDATWVDLQEVSEIDLDFISGAIRVPRIVLESKAVKESYPRIDFFNNYTTIFLRDSKLQSEGAGVKDINISKNNMLIICAQNYIATISTGRSELFDRMIGEGIGTPKLSIIISRMHECVFERVWEIVPFQVV